MACFSIVILVFGCVLKTDGFLENVSLASDIFKSCVFSLYLMDANFSGTLLDPKKLVVSLPYLEDHPMTCKWLMTMDHG